MVGKAWPRCALRDYIIVSLHTCMEKYWVHAYTEGTNIFTYFTNIFWGVQSTPNNSMHTLSFKGAAISLCRNEQQDGAT